MTDHSSGVIAQHDEDKRLLRSYVLGFILSILLTLASYVLVSHQLLSTWVLILTIIGLGLVQMAVQLILFLHIGDEPKPRWNLLVLLFMLMVAAILVFGSLWIMYTLEYRSMPPSDMEASMRRQHNSSL